MKAIALVLLMLLACYCNASQTSKPSGTDTTRRAFRNSLPKKCTKATYTQQIPAVRPVTVNSQANLNRQKTTVAKYANKRTRTHVAGVAENLIPKF
ncbi:hypothetical protein [Mucilaginibacter paludis]|uniref:Secreted protein n=1 Tax=Mucilaginibacter paludis DSM 18603 TaxID=714943 RepID=H1YCM5_9SPHI|nr:hypothetical protein [Mucilaginibacter paludis]EHQ24212.1 hypothetical protein Mucpa_0008 [Mucilaginibacter paludis DSM 18603]